MNPKALQKISYGMYTLTSGKDSTARRLKPGINLIEIRNAESRGVARSRS
jgi:hypothetical protein